MVVTIARVACRTGRVGVVRPERGSVSRDTGVCRTADPVQPLRLNEERVRRIEFAGRDTQLPSGVRDAGNQRGSSR